MINKTENQPYIYPLKTPRRGSLTISKSDPRNNAKSLRVLRSLYDFVYVVDDEDLFVSTLTNKNESLIIDTLSIENIGNLINSPTTNTTTSVQTQIQPALTQPSSKTVTIIPPVNLTVDTVNVYGTDGTLTMSANIAFDSYNTGYTVSDFEIILTDQKVNNVSSINSLTQDGNKIIWNIVSSATNYVIEVKQSGTNSIAPILVASPAVSPTTTTVDYTFSGLSGSYNITVTPYNNLGIAGTAKTASFAF